MPILFAPAFSILFKSDKDFMPPLALIPILSPTVFLMILTSLASAPFAEKPVEVFI